MSKDETTKSVQGGKAKPLKPTYRHWVTPKLVDEVSTKVIQRLMIDKKYRDPKFTAGQLADELGINPRQVSAVVAVRFQQNYSRLVNDMRIREAMYMLQDRHFDNMKVDDVAINVGYSTRQSFFTEFKRRTGMTPGEYRLKYSETIAVIDEEP